MFNKQNFCHIASNNRNDVKAGVFVYKTTDDLDTVSVSGYFNEKIVDINLHDLIIHEWHDPADRTKVQRNVLCVTERTLDNVGTVVIKSKWDGDIEQEIADLRTYVDETFIRKDGTSIMTGPLKFRAGSFEGAIAGGLGDGIAIYKLKADGSIDSEVASLTKTNGFVPGTNNAMDVGGNNLKWKDAYIARVITAVINNGYDIAVPVTNSADTLALKSEVDLAANSGRMITDEGVWYAKMAAAGTIPAEAAVEGRNYADFTQVDGSGNPIIVIYTYTSGAWTQTETITPPAEYDGYVPVTSKIWDIAEQAGQQGGRILWNHQSKEFTPYPMIISFENIDVTGESTVAMPATPVPEQIVNKQYVDNLLGSAFANRDLSNLTSTGTNIGNWSSNVSNCITEIPQDIKLELNNGTLTLKAGSKIYVPNGSEIFNTVTITADCSNSISSDDKYMITALADGRAIIYRRLATQTASGTTTPTSSYWMYYNTSDNKVYQIDNGVNTQQLSLPIAIVTVSGGAITSIDQVFNGFGYIGSHVFFTPNFSVLTPNGRNADGTLANLKYTFTSCTVYTRNLSYDQCPLWVRYNGTITFSTGVGYDPVTNQSGGGGGYAQVATADLAAGVISNFQPNLAFRAVDYSDTNVDFVVATQLPTSTNHYTWYRKYKSGWVEQGQKITDGTTSITLPVPMANDFYTITVGQNGAQSGEVRRAAISGQTTTGFNIDNNSANMRPIFWEVKGMAA